MKAKDSRLAERLRKRGWLVFAPERMQGWTLKPGGVVHGDPIDGQPGLMDFEPDVYTVVLRPAVPPAGGGHDV